MADEESESGLAELFEEASSASTEQHEPSVTTEGACQRTFNFELSFERCFMCGVEHDSPEFGPYCAVCHDFLHPTAFHLLACERETENTQFATSGETTSSESATSESRESPVCSGVVQESEDSGCESEKEILSESNDSAAFELMSTTRYKLPYLSRYERVRAPNSIAKRLANELNFVEEDLFETLPPEILLMIFSFLDDISLCMVGQVCQWWRELAGETDDWKKHVLTRWPLFVPDNNIKSWQKLYVKMLEGVACRRCFEKGCIQHAPEDNLVNDWRNKRLRSELKGLLMDPPEGIRACPLDKSLSYWQASIKGPPECPYEGGLFYLHLEIPKSYPMRPPIPRFITRIFHPNVSYHGDIGMDMLRENWSLALTIPKVLVSIQSLMTDPYCRISMEPEIAKLCESDREEFYRVAREWTAKYAQLHLTC